MGQWVGALCRLKMTKICLLCDVTCRKPHQKRKTFSFRCQLEDLLNP